VYESDGEQGANIVAAQDFDYHLIVSYVTETAGPPHKVVIRDNINGWVDVPMTAVEANGQTTWIADLKTSSDQGPTQVEFKLVLDDKRWMAGANQTGTTGTPEMALSLDDNSVTWEGKELL
jgi:hypothetical protein